MVVTHLQIILSVIRVTQQLFWPQLLRPLFRLICRVIGLRHVFMLGLMLGLRRKGIYGLDSVQG